MIKSLLFALFFGDQVFARHDLAGHLFRIKEGINACAIVTNRESIISEEMRVGFVGIFESGLINSAIGKCPSVVSNLELSFST